MLDWLSENRNLLLRLLGTLVASLLIVLLIQQEVWEKIVEAVKIAGFTYTIHVQMDEVLVEGQHEQA